MRYIYFARGLASGLVKIGCTHGVHQRSLGLVRMFRESLEVVAVVPGTMRDEKAMHSRLVHLRADRGREWYRDDGTINAMIEALPAERRGSMVVAFDPTKSPRKRRTREEIAADKVRLRIERGRRFESHGHPGWSHPNECAQCRRWRAASRAPITPRPRPVHDALPAFVYPLRSPLAIARALRDALTAGKAA